MPRPGDVAEWLGRGLQSLVQRFESARRLVARNGVARLPGGTIQVRGVAAIAPTVKLAVAGGPGIYAGATGVVEGRHLANGVTLNVCRLKLA